MKHLGDVEEPSCVVATTEETGLVGAGGHSKSTTAHILHEG